MNKGNESLKDLHRTPIGILIIYSKLLFEGLRIDKKLNKNAHVYAILSKWYRLFHLFLCVSE